MGNPMSGAIGLFEEAYADGVHKEGGLQAPFAASRESPADG